MYKRAQSLVALGYSFCVDQETGHVIPGSGKRGGQDCAVITEGRSG